MKNKKTKASDMPLKIDIPTPELLKPRIVIFGVGGAGGNAINNMIRSNLEGVEFVAANTDAQALEHSLAENQIQLGAKTTRGLGAGSFPDRGRAAAEENIDEIVRYLEGSNMVFIAAGMGGGTGTGAAPVIAKLARERDILAVGVVTKPFHFEGKYRMEAAEKGIDELKKYVDTMIVIPNQNLFRVANENTTFESAFKMADDVLHAGVRGITDLITMPGLVNLDFADIRTIMTKMGKAMMGTGEAAGENRAILACEAAISNPLLDDISIKGAKGVLVNMTGGPDMTLFEADMAVNAIRKEVDPNANIIFGSAFNEDMEGKIRISVVATGIDIEEFKREAIKINESHEPSRFMVDLSEIGDHAEAGSKSFFDTGSSAKPQIEEIEEINETNFKPKKPFTKEQNSYHGRASRAQKEAVEEFTQSSFLVEEIDKKLSIEDLDEEIEMVIEEKTEIHLVEKPKKHIEKEVKEGFNLFGLFGGKKNQEEEEESFEVEENLPKKNHKKVKSSVKTVEEKIQNSEKSIEKKREEFFGAVFDDEEEEQVESAKIEDDILNVPAFFRKKK